MIITKEIIKKAPNTKYVGFYSNKENTVLTFFNDMTSTLVATIEVEDKLVDGDYVFSNSLFSVLKKNINKENNLTFNKALTLKIDNSKFTFNPIEDVKIKIEDPGENDIGIIAKVNKENLINSLMFVGDSNNYRPILAGVNISEDHICSTDSYKCYMNGTFNDKNWTIPQEFIKEIIKSSEEEIKIINDGGNRISANVDGICWYSSIYNGIYPDISKIIKIQNNSFSYEFDNTKTIKELINQALMVIEQENAKIIVENKTFNIVVKDKYQGQTQLNDMPNMKIIFSKPIFEVLGKFIQQNATLYYSGENRPLYIEKDQEIIVLLPVKEI